MTPPRTIVLDNEAVHALRSTSHPKHGQAIAHVQVVREFIRDPSKASLPFQ